MDVTDGDNEAVEDGDDGDGDLASVATRENPTRLTGFPLYIW